MKNNCSSFLFTVLIAAGLALTAKAVDSTYQWTGAAGPDADGVYDFLDKGNWTRTAGSDANWPRDSKGAITASGKSYDLNLVATDAEIKLKMPSGAIYWKGTLNIADGGKYRFVGTDMTATQKFNSITLGAAAALTVETMDLELVNNALTVPSDASFTMIGATMRATSTSNYSSIFKGALTLKSGSFLDIYGNFYCEQGGVFFVEGKSTLYLRKVFSLCTGANGEPSELTIDDSSVIVGTTVNFCSRGVTGGNVFFKGQSPLLLAKSSFGCSSQGGVVCNFTFDLPAGGYAIAPIVVGDSGTSNNFPNNGNPTVVIDGASAAFASDTDGTFPLIASAGAQIKNLGLTGVNAWVLNTLPADIPDGADVQWRYSGSKAAVESTYPFTPTLPEIAWEKSALSANCILGVYIKGVSGEDEPEEPPVEPVEPGQPSAPQFASFAADGSAGDTIAVSGKLGVGGTVTVEVSTTEDFAAIYSSADKGTVATNGTFEATFHNAGTSAPDGIRPGATYYVRAIAVSLEEGCGLVTTSKVVKVTTAAASGITVTGYTHANGTVTITGRLNPLGAGTSTIHILWGNDGMDFPNDETVVRDASTGPDWTFAKTNYTDFFCYKIYVENSCAGESWSTTPVLGKGSETPADVTDTFYWKADADGNWSGDWEDPAHWDACDSSGNPITTFHADFPDQTESFRKFSFSRIPEGAEVTVNLPARAMSWGTMDDIGRANAALIFKGTPNKTVITFSSTSERHMELAGEKIVLDGLSLTFPSDLRMRNVNQTLEIRNKANVLFKAYNQSLHLQNGGAAGLGSTLIVDDATLDMTHGDGAGGSNAIFLSEGGKETTPVRIIVRGRNPQLLLAGVVNRTATSGAAKMKQQIVFEVPEGGYAETPIKGINVNRFGYRSNSGSFDGIEILVDRASPALLKPFTPQTVTQDLIFWDGGIDISTAMLDNGGANVELPAKNLMKCYFNDATNPTKVQVDFWCLASKGTVFVIYGKEEK